MLLSSPFLRVGNWRSENLFTQVQDIRWLSWDFNLRVRVYCLCSNCYYILPPWRKEMSDMLTSKKDQTLDMGGIWSLEWPRQVRFQIKFGLPSPFRQTLRPGATWACLKQAWDSWAPQTGTWPTGIEIMVCWSVYFLWGSVLSSVA